MSYLWVLHAVEAGSEEFDLLLGKGERHVWKVLALDRCGLGE